MKLQHLISEFKRRNVYQVAMAEAKILASLGQKNAAVQALTKAFKQEYTTFSAYSFQFDPWLLPLHDYPPFEELVKPK